MKRRASPTLMLLAVPAIQVEASPALSCQGVSVCAGMAFSAMTAVRSEEVSNICCFCPGPGTLWTRVPEGMSTLSGEHTALERVKASMAEADTPGDGT